MTVSAPKLRPLGIGQLLDQAIRLYRRKFSTLIGIIAVAQIPLSILSLLFSLITFSDSFSRLDNAYDPYSAPSGFGDLFGPGYFIGMAGSLIVILLNFVLIQGVATSALTRAVADEYLGETTDFIGAYRKIGRAWPKLIVALIAAMLVSLGLLIWFLIPCVGWFTGLGIFAFFAAVLVPLISPVVVLEGESGWRALRRAWDLSRRRFWWVAGFVAILWLFNQLVVSGPTTLMSLLFNFLGDSLFPSGDSSLTFLVSTIIQAIITLVFSLLYLPLQLTAMTLLYFDLRVRTEGLDLALQAEGASQAEISIAALLERTPGPAEDGLVTGTELGYFVLLSLAMGALWMLLAGLLAALGMAALSMGGGFPGF